MMKTKQFLQLLLVSALLVFAWSSCRKSPTASTNENSRLKVQIQAVNKSVQLPVQVGATRDALLAGSGATVTWDSASLEVSTVRFEAEMKSKLMAGSHQDEDDDHPGYSRDSIEVKFTLNGPQRINLLSPNAVFGGFTLGPGLYDEMELYVKGLKSDAGSNPVFYLSGTYTTSNLQTRHILVAVNQDVAFKSEQDSVVVSGSGIDIISVIHIFLDRLMAGIPVSSLDNAVLQGNGDLLISANSNADLYAILLQNLRLDHPVYHHDEGENDDHDHDSDHESDHDDD